MGTTEAVTRRAEDRRTKEEGKFTISAKVVGNSSVSVARLL
jgi:hypothetical protein